MNYSPDPVHCQKSGWFESEFELEASRARNARLTKPAQASSLSGVNASANSMTE